MKRFFFLFIFVIFAMSNYVSAQVNVYPLTEDFKMIPYPIPPCSQIGKITELYYKVNDTYWIAVAGPIKVECPGVNNISVEILGIKNVTVPQYNLTLTLINATVKTEQKEYEPLGLVTRNITIEYKRYNETYELVTVKIENMKMYWSYALQDYVYPNLTPEYYGFPSNITINLLINRKTGEGYLLDNGIKKYVGVTPLWNPALNPSEYPKLVLRNLRNLINQIKANPWIVENVVQKAKLSNNISESNSLLNSLALNFTEQVMSLQVTYLGRKMYLENSGSLPCFMLPIDGTYLIRTYQTGWQYLPSKIDNMSPDKYVEKVLTDYLKTRNDEELKRLILLGVFHEKVYLPILVDFDDVHNKVTAIDFTLPPSEKSHLLVLPLPKKYAEAFNATYLMLNFVGPHTMTVKYDPSLYTPKEVTSEWIKEGACMGPIKSTLMNGFMNAFLEFEESGMNITALDKIYENVQKNLELCGFNATSATTDNSTQPKNPLLTVSTTSNSQSPAVSGSSISRKKNREGICGPAFLVPLALIPVWMWRKRK
ncbi:hypothetical protein A3L09_00635 [Thermococcus profundus]|uniref:CGP-CTERM sorting domain-containing protein n=1 Tax=Thermococcus profundus TaxID=49899 RepID=A0A2Z2MIT5_THEPR|nr:CGP-CTERM sorting domain-containing protein [Thermococcus profundus]ASJ01868.1 hypothetical protein A3L09_00635 [Thermococcus profundus]